jgi:hypothetical protein
MKLNCLFLVIFFFHLLYPERMPNLTTAMGAIIAPEGGYWGRVKITLESTIWTASKLMA